MILLTICGILDILQTGTIAKNRINWVKGLHKMICTTDYESVKAAFDA